MRICKRITSSSWGKAVSIFLFQGENRFIESLCQTILPMEEILWVLNHESIDYNIKKPYLQYLHWVYMRSSGSFIDTGAGELTHDM